MTRSQQLLTVAAALAAGGAFLPAAADPTLITAAPKSYTETIPGSKVAFEMVGIPGGTFAIGSPVTEPGRAADEGPQRLVAIRPFWMGKCEVTWDEFDLYWKVEPDAQVNPKEVKAGADAITRPTQPYVDETYEHEREGHPALCMTHHAAMEYCRWISQLTGKTYRLPTEAEWEYACRAGSKTAYCFGDDPVKLEEYGWFKKNSPDEDHRRGTTHKVGSLKANAFGLHDMHGNVWEWCLDHYRKDAYGAYAKDKATLAPVFVPTAAKFPHPVRGGSWADEPPQLRSAARRASDPNWMRFDPQRPQSIWWLTKMDVIGFRVVRAVEEQDELKGLRSKVTKKSPDY